MSNPTTNDDPQSTIPDYQYVLKKIVIGSTSHTAQGIVPVHGNQFYVNEVDFEYILSTYLMTVRATGILGWASYPTIEYRIEDPYLKFPESIHPMQPGPTPIDGHVVKIFVNNQYVGSIRAVSDKATYPDENNSSNGPRPFTTAAFDNLNASDLISLFKLLNVSSVLTDQSWTFPSSPSQITPRTHRGAPSCTP